jgi:hypothetical protein
MALKSMLIQLQLSKRIPEQNYRTIASFNDLLFLTCVKLSKFIFVIDINLYLVEAFLSTWHCWAFGRSCRTIFVVPFVHLIDQSGSDIIASCRDVPVRTNCRNIII